MSVMALSLAISCEDPILKTDEGSEYFEIGGDGGQCEIVLTTNLKYNVEIPEEAQDWISYKIDPIKTRSTRNERILFNINKNATGITRKATVSISDTKQNSSITVFFRQAPSYLTISVSEGALTSQMMQYDYQKIEKLKIVGRLNSDDFKFMREVMRIEDLDLSEVDITEIPSQAFYRYAFLRQITLPKKLLIIQDKAFYYASRLEAVTIPASVTTIGDYAFEGDGSVTWSNLSTVSFEKGSQLKTIGQGAFSYRTMTKIEFPASVETIGSFAFRFCKSLDTITFESNSQLKSIGFDAFDGCKELKIVDMSECTGVSDIGSDTLRSTGIQIFLIGTKTPPKILAGSLGNEIKKAILKVPSGCVDAYKAATYWKDFGGITALDE